MVDNLANVINAPITFLLPVRIRGCDQLATFIQPKRLAPAGLHTNKPWQPKSAFFECFVSVCRQQLLGIVIRALYRRFFLANILLLDGVNYPFYDLCG
jgi:hypothetical protein